MKKVTPIILILLFTACNYSRDKNYGDSRASRDRINHKYNKESRASNFTFSIWKTSFNSQLPYNKEQFFKLITDSSDLTVDFIAISTKGPKHSIVYLYGEMNDVFFHKARIKKNNDSSFSIFENHWLLLNGKSKFTEFLKWDFVINDSEIYVSLDTTFPNYLSSAIYDKDKLLSKYNLYKNDNNFTSSKSGLIGVREKLLQLANDMTIAAIGGCAECKDIIMTYDSIFNIMKLGTNSEDLRDYKKLIKRTDKQFLKINVP